MKYLLLFLVVCALFLFGCTQICSDQYSPVCGSDGKTYRNSCYAYTAGVGVAYEGVCKEPMCTDTDNGKNVFEKGKVLYKNTEYIDSCSDKAVVEYYCADGGMKSESITCPEGYFCNNGKCAPSPSMCYDSDGLDAFTAGKVEFGDEKFNDVCKDSTTITEYYCVADKPATKEIPCGKGYACNMGRCVEKCTSTSQVTLYDIYKQDTTTLGAISKTDFCLDAERVVDFYCKEGRIENKTTYCPTGYVCQDGACSTPSCKDSDNGKDVSVAGKVMKGRSVYTDTCYDLNKVREYYCADNEVKLEIIDCPPKYTCSDGVCVPFLLSTCIDDEKEVNMYKRGKVVYNGIEYEDFCITTSKVRDYYCEGSELAHVQFLCPPDYYCNGGACIKKVECYDSDGGVNKNVAGYVIVDNGPRVYDECYTASSVVEHSCTFSGMISQTLDCGYGHVCENGECK